jgi:hypothetical protein
MRAAPNNCRGSADSLALHLAIRFARKLLELLTFLDEEKRLAL